MKPIIAALFLAGCSCAHDRGITVEEPTDPVVVTMMPLGFSRAAPTCPDDGLLKIHGVIDDSEPFVSEIDACAGRAVVVVEINSVGGSIFDALEMQKAIERSPGLVVCVVDGMAASAAFVTLQSCDIRMMTSRSVLMAHGGSTTAGGQSHQLKNRAIMLEKIDRAMVLFCAKRMDMAPDDYEARVSGGKEWWMGVEDAQVFKAIDAEAPSAYAMARVLTPASDAGTP